MEKKKHLGCIDINIYASQKPRGVTGVTLIGLLDSADVKPPKDLESYRTADGNSVYGVLDVVGVHTDIGRFYSKGRVLTLVPSHVLERAKSKQSGKLAVVLNGGKLSLQGQRSQPYVLNSWWKKGDYNNWLLAPVNITPLVPDEYPEFMEVIKNSYSDGQWDYTFPISFPPQYTDASQGVTFDMHRRVQKALPSMFSNGIQSATQQTNAMVQEKMATGFNPNQPVEQKLYDFNPTPTEMTNLGGTTSSGLSEIENNRQQAMIANPERYNEKNSFKEQVKNKLVSKRKDNGINTRYELAPESAIHIELMNKYLEALDIYTNDMKSKILSYNDKAYEKVGLTSELIENYKEEHDLEDDTDLLESLMSEPKYNKVLSGREKENFQYFLSKMNETWYVKDDMLGKRLLQQGLTEVFPYEANLQSGDLIEQLIEEEGIGVLGYFVKDIFEDLDDEEKEEITTKHDRVNKLKSLKHSLYMKGTDVYYTILEIVLGLTKGTITTILTKGTDLTADAVDLILQENPYLLSYTSMNYNMKDLDILALYYGVDLSREDIQESRNNAYIHMYLMDKTSRLIGSHTIVNRDALLKKLKIGLRVTQKEYNIIRAISCLLSPQQLKTIQMYFNPKADKEMFAIPSNGWVKDGRHYLLPSGVSTIEAMSSFVNSGLGLQINFKGKEYIMDITNAEKEMYVYNKLRRMALKSHINLPSEEELEECIKTFEEEKGFKLEKEQKDAIKNLDKGALCLTGPGGSGKTTTIELLIGILETYADFKGGSAKNKDDVNVLFAAPTGGAAKRLKEVVKRNTSTIHSAFRTSGKMTKIYTSDSGLRISKENNIYIFDEMSMVDSDMMYEMMKRINEDNSILFFGGDIEQLPPIGIGKPFATMLTYLPTVKLEVSKRASEGSLITKNAKKIIDESDGVLEDLEVGHHFGVEQTKNEDEMVLKLRSIINYHLNGTYDGNFTKATNDDEAHYDADDIVVISPINKHAWGVDNINRHLQAMMNPAKPNQRTIQYTDKDNMVHQFRKGDKVAHLVNLKEEERYQFDTASNKFKMIKSKGVVNGDLGKVVGIWRAEELPLEENDQLSAEDIEKIHNRFGTVYMVCEYEGYSSQNLTSYKYCIFYPMPIALESGELYSVSPRISYKVKLGYCLTTHKLQGSAGKLVISLIKSVGGDFISRNMLYTIITRARETFYFIGDVYGEKSAVNTGRKIMQTNRRQSPIDLYRFSASLDKFADGGTEEEQKYLSTLHKVEGKTIRDLPMPKAIEEFVEMEIY